MVVSGGAAMSSPWWVGRWGVRNPDTIGPWTGWVHGPAAPQAASAACALPLTLETTASASGSCLAYASGKALRCTARPAAVRGGAARGRRGWARGGGAGEAGRGVGAGGDGDAAGADDRRAEAAHADEEQDAGEQGDGFGGHAGNFLSSS